jgi:hypothetical protein
MSFLLTKQLYFGPEAATQLPPVDSNLWVDDLGNQLITDNGDNIIFVLSENNENNEKKNRR